MLSSIIFKPFWHPQVLIWSHLQEGAEPGDTARRSMVALLTSCLFLKTRKLKYVGERSFLKVIWPVGTGGNHLIQTASHMHNLSAVRGCWAMQRWFLWTDIPTSYVSPSCICFISGYKLKDFKNTMSVSHGASHL